MAPTAEQFCRNVCHQTPESVGSLSEKSVDPKGLIPTRPFLTEERIEGKKRRGNPSKPDVIRVGEDGYLIDGHHKARRAADNGQNIECRILQTDDQRIIEELRRRAQECTITDLEVR